MPRDVKLSLTLFFETQTLQECLDFGVISGHLRHVFCRRKITRYYVTDFNWALF